MQMFNVSPPSWSDVLDYYFKSFVNADAYDSDFVSPMSFVFHYHLLIVRHRFLARGAPGSPEINANNLTRFMNDVNRFIFEYVVNICDCLVVIANHNRRFDIELYSLRMYSCKYLFEVCL